MKMSPLFALLVLSSLGCGDASGAAANPIRKVVTMLQNMQKKISSEGEKKEAAFDKYMCYCKNADSTLGQGISDAQTKIPQVESAIKEGAASKKQMEADLKDAQVGRVEAKDTIAKSTAIREREAKAFAAKKSELDTNIGALNKAIPAIEKGMSGAFLQTNAASTLRQISLSADMISADRDLLASFLSTGSNYAPKSGEITGILKTLKDEMEKDLAGATSDENSAIASCDSLIAAKEKEIQALTKGIESKTMRIGELGVKIAQMENDLEDTKEGLAEDQKFYADLDKNCALKKAEWAAYKEMEAKELVALADTIKILNDDDALELFKKTLPGASSSFMQVQVGKSATQHHALSALKAVKKADPRLDFIEMAMRGGKMGFGKIIKMIDNLVVELKAEQGIDSDKKSYCLAEFDKAEDKKKGLDLDISDLGKAIEDNQEQIASLASAIKALAKGIKDLDSSVSEATATRKEEHDNFVETLAANNAAKDLLGFAKNRLQKFYNPKLYKAPPAREVGFAQGQGVAAPPPPPEANLAYKKSGSESGGVINMIDLLVADLDKDIQTSQVDEKDAQSDYETFMSDASEKRALDSKAITDNESAKAENESNLQSNKDSKGSKTIEAMETAKYLGGLHGECDWLLKNFDARQAARTGEIDALGKAKSVLSGADYSLVQTSAHLRGSQ
jgi:septal ring factor EnvC (AmiA/AmiB activator)